MSQPILKWSTSDVNTVDHPRKDKSERNSDLLKKRDSTVVEC